MQRDRDKSQGEYLSLLWRNTHCRERREIEEYSSLKVTDSDNNSIKESVKFSKPSNPNYFFTSESELQRIQNSSYKTEPLQRIVPDRNRTTVQKEPDWVGLPRFPPNRAQKLQVPKKHTLCSHFSLFKHFKFSSHAQCGTKCF